MSTHNIGIYEDLTNYPSFIIKFHQILTLSLLGKESRVIPRKWWLCPDMTEKFLTGMLNDVLAFLAEMASLIFTRL